MDRKNIFDITDTLTCRGRRVFVILEGRKCTPGKILAKMCPKKNLSTHPSISKETVREDKISKVPMVKVNGGRW